MKIHELLNERVDLSKPVPVDLKGRTFMPISGDLVGKGIQARVYGNSTGQVTKVAAVDPKKGMDDSAVAFIKIALENQHNTFFPRIYHAVLYADKENPKAYQNLVIQMERLAPLSSVKVHESAVRLFKQIGFDLDEKIVKMYFNPEKDVEANEKHIEAITSKAQDVFVSTKKGGAYTGSLEKLAKKSRNKDFVDAVGILAPLMEKYGADLHEGNWMIRLTQYGPQLVIVDPFFPTTLILSNVENENKLDDNERRGWRPDESTA